MDSFRSLPINKSNRTPTTRAPASYVASPYRSINVALPVVAPASAPSSAPASKDPLVAALARATGDDAKDLMRRIEAALREVAGGEVDVVQSQGECTMSCRVDAKDDARCCSIAVNLFDVSGEKDAPGNFLVEGARMSGCPVLFGHVTRHFMQGLGKTQGASPSMLQHCAKADMRRPFQAPALPEAFLEEDAVADAEVAAQLDRSASLALSQVAETRVMAIRALADACKDEKCAALFGRKGVARISTLLTDNDPMVRLAALRVSQRVDRAAATTTAGA